MAGGLILIPVYGVVWGMVDDVCCGLHVVRSTCLLNSDGDTGVCHGRRSTRAGMGSPGRGESGGFAFAKDRGSSPVRWRSSHRRRSPNRTREVVSRNQTTGRGDITVTQWALAQSQATGLNRARWNHSHARNSASCVTASSYPLLSIRISLPNVNNLNPCSARRRTASTSCATIAAILPASSVA